ncbi:MAG: tyrosine recombinase XerC [Azonexus sp.]|jgi:integrase/recombinase XerC|nr:tyrosine recombinase XerC [Azonexus sp.]
MTAATTTDAWLALLTEQHRQSPHTVSNYRRDLRYLRELAGETPLERLQVHDIRRFVIQLHSRGLSGRSLARLLSAWRGFFAWLGEDDAVRANPCTGVRPPKSPRLLPKALSVDEMKRLLDPTAALPDMLARRDAAMFELFYSSGLRLAELAALDCDAFATARDDGEIRVVGKRAKERLVPVGQKAREALADWMTVRATLARADEPALFVGRYGRRLGHRAIELRLDAWTLRQNLPQRVHPHMLRHCCASHLLQSSSDLRAVQEILGHASIASTQVYTHLDFQHLAKVYDAAHPRARAK